MPTPLRVLSSLFGRSGARPREPWFRVLRVWNEVGDICEAECFADGHRKSIVEHTVHFLLLPGVHSGRSGRHTPPNAASESSLDIVPSHLYSLPHFQRSSQPSLVVPGTRMCWPSPFHLQLRVISRLEFNGERVTYHRDFWDVKDLVALVPGAKLAQYVGTRFAARALATVGHLGAWFWGEKSPDPDPGDAIPRSPNADNTLGLLGIDVESARPDVH
ncbi:hypothetical protein K439DRAFT_1625926 [Ramaria rubella]|nr:hypothetical protein K439DRAFT_1625926 [Ramaria rubella]